MLIDALYYWTILDFLCLLLIDFTEREKKNWSKLATFSFMCGYSGWLQSTISSWGLRYSLNGFTECDNIRGFMQVPLLKVCSLKLFRAWPFLNLIHHTSYVSSTEKDHATLNKNTPIHSGERDTPLSSRIKYPSANQKHKTESENKLSNSFQLWF